MTRNDVRKAAAASGSYTSTGLSCQAPEGSSQYPTTTQAAETNPSTAHNVESMPSHSQQNMSQFDPGLAMYQTSNLRNSRSQALPVTAFYMNPVSTPSGAALAGKLRYLLANMVRW